METASRSTPDDKDGTAASASSAGRLLGLRSRAAAEKPRHATPSGKPKVLQSGVTNGRRVFAVGGDGRNAWTRRFRDLHAIHVSDIGGPDGLSEAQVSLCRRCAAIEVQLEAIEAAMSLGEAKIEDLDLYNRLSGNLRRLFETLGLERQARDVTPNPLARHFSARVIDG